MAFTLGARGGHLIKICFVGAAGALEDSWKNKHNINVAYAKAQVP